MSINDTKSVKKHAWEKEEVDGGPLGTDEFWACFECGASGGAAFHPFTGKETTPRPFLPGPASPLSEDCEEARQQVELAVAENASAHPCRRSGNTH